MNKSAKEKAKKRMNLILNSNKPNETDSTQKARWDFNKEYGLNFHDKAVTEVIKNLFSSISYLILRYFKEFKKMISLN